MLKEFSIFKWLSNMLSPLESLGDVKLCPEFSNDTCPPRSKKSTNTVSDEETSKESKTLDVLTKDDSVDRDIKYDG